MTFPERRGKASLDKEFANKTKHCWMICSSPLSMTKIFISNSTLNKSKFLRLQLNLMGPFNDSILLVKIVGDIPRSSPGSSILDMPRHEKKDFGSTSICASTVFFEIHFHRRIPMRGTDETYMVETAVCPITISC